MSQRRTIRYINVGISFEMKVCRYQLATSCQRYKVALQQRCENVPYNVFSTLHERRFS